MGQLTLLLAFHNHQPDGNFEHVFAQGYDDCYGPLLRAIAEFPKIRLSMHHTGALFEWLDKNRPEYMQLLRKLVDRNQVEIMGGGFYEPMLAVLSERDAAGQIAMMNRFVEAKLGTRPTGMWLAERVWEPALAETIGRTGLKYTLTDDTHFRNAGMLGDLSGYYVTEKAGTPLAIFPIEKELRYAIPFKQPHEAMKVLYDLAERAGDRKVAATYGDDGEKFGMWPGTKEWVWDKGWLKEFFRLLSEAPEDKIKTGLLREALDEFPPSGRVYLPTASYHEMGEWALPAETQIKLESALHELDHNPYWKERLAPFVRGGLWQNFFAKYPEANFMHKKMVVVSDKLAAAAQRSPDAPELEDATRKLYRAQTNCGYWHGLFGGVYLNYIRHAVYTHLIGAEETADKLLGNAGKVIARKVDLDADMVDEIELATPELRAYVKADEGGGVYELDVIRKRMNLLNVMGRRREGYHDKLKKALADGDHGGGGAQPKSIHDIVIVKDRSIGELLEYDRTLRLAFVDHFVAPAVSCHELARNRYQERGDFARGRYQIGELESAGGVPSVKLSRVGQVDGVSVRIDKTISIDSRKLVCRYRLVAERALEIGFASESALTLLAGNDEKRRYRLPPGARGELGQSNLASYGELDDASGLEMVDEWLGLAVRIAAKPAARICRFPLESASQSEGGFERTYQGSSIVSIWTLALAAGRPAELEVSISADDL